MRHAHRNLFYLLVGFIWPIAAVLEQPVSAFSQQSSAPPPAQSSSQAQSSPQTQSQTQAPRKAKEKKAATAKGKVLTEDDLSGLKGGVSVVGTEGSTRATRRSTTNQGANDAASGEAYWRGKAQPLLQQIADMDQRMAQLKRDIKKYGIGGIDVASGMKEGVAYVEDRNGQIQKLEKKKANLQKQLEDLEEEGRKAGAEPAWFR
ncbi:MAG: hypothetical protein DMG40_09245 [Acidobacteria bacterium]|nr:MAG: hypothetical protein DMG40_09245 [Acidobacteriota bacterium]